MQKKAHEILLFFDTDNTSNPNSTFYTDFVKTNGKTDNLIFYKSEKNDNYVLCLVEMKGTDVNHAVDQVINTFIKLKENIPPKYHPKIIWKVVIVSGKSSPTKPSKEKNDLLNNNFQKKNVHPICSGVIDIDIFIRT